MQIFPPIPSVALQLLVRAEGAEVQLPQYISLQGEDRSRILGSEGKGFKSGTTKHGLSPCKHTTSSD